MIDSPPFALYDQKNWLQPTAEMPFSRVLDTPNLVASNGSPYLRVSSMMGPEACGLIRRAELSMEHYIKD